MPRMNRTGQFRGYACIALGGLEDMHAYETVRCIDGASAHQHEVHRSAYLRHYYFLSRPDASIRVWKRYVLLNATCVHLRTSPLTCTTTCVYHQPRGINTCAVIATAVKRRGCPPPPLTIGTSIHLPAIKSTFRLKHSYHLFSKSSPREPEPINYSCVHFSHKFYY